MNDYAQISAMCIALADRPAKEQVFKLARASQTNCWDMNLAMNTLMGFRANDAEEAQVCFWAEQVKMFADRLVPEPVAAEAANAGDSNE